MDNATLTYRLLAPGEETAVSDLIIQVFDEFIAGGYSQEGVQEFLAYVTPEGLAKRVQENHFTLVAAAGDSIVGVIEVRACDHVSLLFVDKAFQGRGISRTLLEQALVRCRGNNPELHEVSVNSSPYAVPIYESLGFCITGPEQTVHGIRFTPMILREVKVQSIAPTNSNQGRL